MPGGYGACFTIQAVSDSKLHRSTLHQNQAIMNEIIMLYPKLERNATKLDQTVARDRNRGGEEGGVVFVYVIRVTPRGTLPRAVHASGGVTSAWGDTHA